MELKAGPRRFLTTRWSLVLAAGDRTSPASETALAILCETYWHPVYGFVRRSGYSSDDARDLTQTFFARLLEKELLKQARPDRGRFRSFVLASLRHFLFNVYDSRHALKRGGHRPHLSLEFDAEERRYVLEPADDLTPEHIYERRWAANVMEIAMKRLAAYHEDPARCTLFEQLKPFLTDDGLVPPKQLALALGMSGGALRVALHRLRRQYAAVLRETIAETVERAEDVEDEVRHLIEVVSRPSV
jgi:DNA-directed RNA polymerase specialized sigma24 family protein